MYLSEPPDFRAKFEVVSCFVEYGGKFLLLLRQDHKSAPNMYGVPAGKVEEGETAPATMIRELYEETWIKAQDIDYFDKVYVRYPDYDYVYHIFHLQLDSKPRITINPEEHKLYIWRNPIESLGENLVWDQDACVKMFYGLE